MTDQEYRAMCADLGDSMFRIVNHGLLNLLASKTIDSATLAALLETDRHFEVHDETGEFVFYVGDDPLLEGHVLELIEAATWSAQDHQLYEDVERAVS